MVYTPRYLAPLDSRVASFYVESLGVKKGKYWGRNSFSAIVIHTTGHGPVTRHLDLPHKYITSLHAALYVYSSVMVEGPHYVIDQEGVVIQLCPEELAAWHVGGSKGRHYSGAWKTNLYNWWEERWPGLESPKELADGQLWSPYPPETRKNKLLLKAWWQSRYGSINANTIGIEVIPPSSNPHQSWNESTMLSLGKLCQDIGRRRQIPLSRSRVVSHSDCDPLSRTTHKGEPWDPWEDQWTYETLEPYLKG